MSFKDQTDDVGGRILYRVMMSNTPPEFVKAASSDEIYGMQEGQACPAHLYGDPVHRKFPCNTPASTWVSAAFYYDSKDELPPKFAEWIEGRIKSSASKFNITNIINSLEEAATTIEKAAAPDDDDYAVVIKYSNGHKERYYPLTDSKLVKEAAEYLLKYRDEIPYRERKTMSEKILEKASKFGCALGDTIVFLEKQAGLGGCAAQDVAALLWGRVRVVGRSDKPTEMQIKLAEMAAICDKKANDVRHPETLQKVAEIVDNFDRAHGLHRQYSVLVPRAEDILFAITEKTASDLLKDHVALTNGSIYKVADLSNVQLEDLKGLMGEDFAEHVSVDGMTVSREKLAELMHTLPRPDADLLDRLFNDTGIERVYKQASVVSTGLSKQDWLDIASLKDH